MFVGSQWFSLPRHVVQWFLQDPLPKLYESYAQYVVIADENYFATLVSNSPYCGDIVRKKNLFLLFDKWENELSGIGERDPRKCLSPDPDHCGRSPSTLTFKFKNLLEISRATFGRKFDPLNPESLQLLDEIDRWRKKPPAVRGGDNGKRIMIRYSGTKHQKSNKDADNVQGAEIGIDGYSSAKGGTGLLPIDSDITAGGNLVRQMVREVQKKFEFDYCWEMNAMGQPLTLAACNATLLSQWFTLGTRADDV